MADVRADRAAVVGRREGELRCRQRGEEPATTPDGVVSGESGDVDGDVAGVLAGGVRDIHVGIGLEPRQSREGERR